MKRWMIIMQVLIVVCMSLFMIGCGQSTQSHSESMTSAEKAAAGIHADCVVNYYRKDKSPYITEQNHTFDAEDGYLKIVSREPYGVFDYILKKNQFSSSKTPKKGLSDLDVDFFDQKLATAIFYSFCGGADLLDTSLYATSDNIKVEGQWYQPFQPQWPSEDLQVTLLKSLSSGRIELIIVENAKTGIHLMGRNYNLRYSQQLDCMVPRKIDIFDISNGISSKVLILQFDYKKIQFSDKSAHFEENNE